MHDASVIVFNIEVGHLVGSVQRKVVLVSRRDVFPHDADKLIAVERRLHVVETESVNEFVDDREESEAANFRDVRRQTDRLPAPTSADAR